MVISQLADIIIEFYEGGKQKATNQSFVKQDAEQYAKLAYADLMRRFFNESKKGTEGEEYYFYSSILAIKKFDLSDANDRDVRRIDLSEKDTYKLPKNAHLTNIYPLCGSCKNIDASEITQVSPGEENFYLTPSFSKFMFYVVKGKGINFYHLPPCIKSVEVESTFSDGDVDVPLDMCYNVANAVIGRMLGIPFFTNKDIDNPYAQHAMNLKQRIAAQPQVQP